MPIDALFAALADPHRRTLFEALRRQPAAVNELAPLLPVTRAAVSQHLRVLLDAELVGVETQGRRRIYHARPETLELLAQYARSEPEGASAEDDPVVSALRKWRPEAPHIDADRLALLMYFARVGDHVWRSNEAIAASVGLRFSDITMLGALRRLGPPFESTPTQLSRTFWITLPGMTKRLSRLEGLGMLQRKPDPDDGRGIRIRLTRKGLDTLRMLVAERQPPEYHALADLGDADRHALLRILPRLLAAIDARHGQSRPPYVVRL